MTSLEGKAIIGYQQYQIEEQTEIVENGEALHGQCRNKERKILLNNSYSSGHHMSNLFHEVIHAVTWMVAPPSMRDQISEDVVSFVSEQIAAFLVANPQIAQKVADLAAEEAA